MWKNIERSRAGLSEDSPTFTKGGDTRGISPICKLETVVPILSALATITYLDSLKRVTPS